MPPNKRQNWLLIIGGLVIVAGVGYMLKGLQSSSVERLYPVKFVCGTMTNLSASSNKPPYGGALAPGKYSTSINIHNLTNENAKIEKVAIRAPREPEYATPSSSSVTLELPAKAATAADCPDIYSIFGFSTSSIGYIEGFLDVRSQSPIAVSAVYTAQALTSAGTVSDLSNIDVEQVLPMPLVK